MSNPTKPDESRLREAVDRYVATVNTTAIFAARNDLREDDKRRLAEAYRDLVAAARNNPIEGVSQ